MKRKNFGEFKKANKYDYISSYTSDQILIVDSAYDNEREK